MFSWSDRVLTNRERSSASVLSRDNLKGDRGERAVGTREPRGTSLGNDRLAGPGNGRMAPAGRPLPTPAPRAPEFPFIVLRGDPLLQTSGDSKRTGGDFVSAGEMVRALGPEGFHNWVLDGCMRKALDPKSQGGQLSARLVSQLQRPGWVGGSGQDPVLGGTGLPSWPPLPTASRGRLRTFDGELKHSSHLCK